MYATTSMLDWEDFMPDQEVTHEGQINLQKQDKGWFKKWTILKVQLDKQYA